MTHGHGPRPRRKPIRLPPAAYAFAGSSWLVTIGTHQRRPIFRDLHLAHGVFALATAYCEARHAKLDAFCLMPDHAHLLLRVGSVGLVDLVREVKSRSTQLWWALGGFGPLWQRAFHDRGIRTDADWQTALRYVVENPQRAGLVDDWRDYPLLGGRQVSRS